MPLALVTFPVPSVVISIGLEAPVVFTLTFKATLPFEPEEVVRLMPPMVRVLDKVIEPLAVI